MPDPEKDVTAVSTSIYIPVDVLEKLDMYARVQRRSRSWMVVDIIMEKLGISPMDEFADASLARKGK